VLDLIAPDQKVSIEREVWPALVDNGLYGFADDRAYWIDIGTPARYLQVTFDILEGNVETDVVQRLGDAFMHVDDSATVEGRVVPPAVVERDAHIAADAHVGSLAVVAEGVSVGEGSIVERSVVLRGARIGAHCVLRNCIICPGATIGDRTQVIDGAMIGEGVKIGSDNVVARGARVFPGMEVPDGGLAF
jgi:mannose-1-phosphate guanylyltransferase